MTTTDPTGLQDSGTTENSPRDQRTCDVCGDRDTDVYTYDDLDDELPTYDAHPSCSYNPVAQSRDDFLEELNR